MGEREGEGEIDNETREMSRILREFFENREKRRKNYGNMI